MSFTLNQVTQRAGGGDIIRTKNIEAAEPVIGRGTDCDIQIADLAVSLRHAVMRQTGRGRVEVKALGQLSFEANGAFTRNAQLALADRPKLIFGSHELRLAPGAGADEIVVTLSRTASVAGEPDVQDEKTVFRLAASMFSRRSAAWTLGAALLALCLVLPVVVFAFYRDAPVAAPAQAVPRADVQWEGGALSPGHRFLEGNCQACHRKAFVSVRDDACLACHKTGLDKQAALDLAAQMRGAGSATAPEPARDHAAADRLARAQPSRDDLAHDIHAAVARTFNHPDGRCASCHTEHVGPAAAHDVKTVTADQVVGTGCADCHAGLKRRLPDTALLDVADWERHPDFRPLVTLSPKEPRVERIALADTPLENNGLIFPHDLHLSKTGGVARMAQELGRARGYGAALDCASCHRTDASGRGYKPVEMVRDCSACHSLAFAHEGGRTMMLPHGHPDQVVATLSAFYASRAAAPATAATRSWRRPIRDRSPSASRRCVSPAATCRAAGSTTACPRTASTRTDSPSAAHATRPKAPNTPPTCCCRRSRAAPPVTASPSACCRRPRPAAAANATAITMRAGPRSMKMRVHFGLRTVTFGRLAVEDVARLASEFVAGRRRRRWGRVHGQVQSGHVAADIAEIAEAGIARRSARRADIGTAAAARMRRRIEQGREAGVSRVGKHERADHRPSRKIHQRIAGLVHGRGRVGAFDVDRALLVGALRAARTAQQDQHGIGGIAGECGHARLAGDDVDDILADRAFDDGAAHADRGDGRADRLASGAGQELAREEAEGALGHRCGDVCRALVRIVDETVDLHARIGADGEDGMVEEKHLQRALLAAGDQIAQMHVLAHDGRAQGRVGVGLHLDLVAHGGEQSSL